MAAQTNGLGARNKQKKTSVLSGNSSSCAKFCIHVYCMYFREVCFCICSLYEGLFGWVEETDVGKRVCCCLGPNKEGANYTRAN